MNKNFNNNGTNNNSNNNNNFGGIVMMNGTITTKKDFVETVKTTMETMYSDGYVVRVPKSENAKQPKCTPEKEEAIMQAFKHFGII